MIRQDHLPVTDWARFDAPFLFVVSPPACRTVLRLTCHPGTRTSAYPGPSRSNPDLSSSGLSRGSISPQAPERVDGWMVGTSPTMTRWRLPHPVRSILSKSAHAPSAPGRSAQGVRRDAGAVLGNRGADHPPQEAARPPREPGLALHGTSRSRGLPSGTRVRRFVSRSGLWLPAHVPVARGAQRQHESWIAAAGGLAFFTAPQRIGPGLLD